MMASAVLVPVAIGIPDEEGADSLLLTKDDHPARTLMPQVAYLPQTARGEAFACAGGAYPDFISCGDRGERFEG